MKILLDVGAHHGKTARVVLGPEYGFDRIVSFEPAPNGWKAIEAIGDPRIELCRFGLSNRTTQATLHDPGSEGASVYDDLEYPDRGNQTVKVDLVRASDWFKKNLSADDIVFMKINTEGSECDILEDLFESGELKKVYNAVVAFDVRRSASLRGRERPLREALRRANYSNLCFSEDVMRGSTHDERIHHWLDVVGAREQLPLDQLRQKYSSTLIDLSRRTGRLARLEQALRVHVLRRLPGPLQTVSKAVWSRLMRGHREGPA